MLRGSEKQITMTEGDFGIPLPIKINGTEILEDDVISFKILDEKNEIIKKEYTNINNNQFDFTLTHEESNKLKPGFYYYIIDLYKNDEFMNNIIKNEPFIVERKTNDEY